MGVFKNDVGRPSNKTITIRNILKGVLLIIIAAAIFAGGYVLNDYQKKEDSGKKESKKTTTIINKKNKTYNPKEAFDKFVKNHNLITYVDDEKHSDDDEPRYDMENLKSINCTTATMARPDASVDVYLAEIYTFNDEDSAKKEFEKQSDYQKTAGDGLVEVFDRKILTDKSKDNYDIVEIKSVVEDGENAGTKSYDYYYGIRIDNYYITLFIAENYGDDKTANYVMEDMIKLKNELNTLLGIK